MFYDMSRHVYRWQKIFHFATVFRVNSLLHTFRFLICSLIQYTYLAALGCDSINVSEILGVTAVAPD